MGKTFLGEVEPLKFLFLEIAVCREQFQEILVREHDRHEDRHVDQSRC